MFHHAMREEYLKPTPLKPYMTYADHLVWPIHVPRRCEPLITPHLSLWGNSRTRATFPTHKKSHNPHPQGERRGSIWVHLDHIYIYIGLPLIEIYVNISYRDPMCMEISSFSDSKCFDANLYARFNPNPIQVPEGPRLLFNGANGVGDPRLLVKLMVKDGTFKASASFNLVGIPYQKKPHTKPLVEKVFFWIPRIILDVQH